MSLSSSSQQSGWVSAHRLKPPMMVQQNNPVFTLSRLRLCLFQLRDSIGSTANNVWPSLCSVSTLSLVSRAKWNNFRKRPSLDTLFLFYPFCLVIFLFFILLIIIIIIAVFMFVYCSHIWVIPSRVRKLQYAVFLPGTVPPSCSNKEGVPSVLHPPSVCPGFNSCQWVAVFFLIVAHLTVQFYATFTWMFMTLSAATKV